MSLIQEALKRQQQENGETGQDSENNNGIQTPAQPAREIKQPELNASDSTSSSPITPPAPPPPIPPTKQQASSPQNKTLGLADKAKTETPAHAIEPEFLKIKKEEKKQSSPWLKLILFIIFLLIIIGVASWMVIYAIKNFTNKEPETVRKTNITKPIPAKVIKENPQKIKNKSDTHKKNILKHFVTKEEKKLKGKPQQSGEVQKTPVVWPHLKISGAMALKSGQGQAIINGKYISINEQIEGVTLIKINNNQITLQYEGEKRTVNVGTSIQ